MRDRRARAGPLKRRAARVGKGRRTGRRKRNERRMAAGKDNGEEPPADSRRAVIWRLPATAGTTESTDAPDAPDAEADRPKDRRVPLPVVWGLVAALVCVGLYAAWSEFGSDILGTSGEPDAAAASASATPSAAEQPGAGATGGEASASPPVAGESAPVVTAEDEAWRGRRGGRRDWPRRGDGAGRRCPAGRRDRSTRRP